MNAIMNAVLSSVLLYSAIYFGSVLLFGFLSMRHMSRSRAGNREGPRALALRSDAPGISLIMPAYNEEVVIVETVRSALANSYPNLEVVVVSDGSKDRTVQVMVEAFDMAQLQTQIVMGPIETKGVRAVYRTRSGPSIIVVDKGASGAKADGSNCGLNFANNPWVGVMDADELIDPDALVHAMTEIMHTPGNVVACGVTLLPSNGSTVENGRVLESPVPRNYWVGCQLIEYLNSYLMAKPGMNVLGAMPNISGGFGLFRRDVVLDIGGYRHGHLGEDMDMVTRIHTKFLESGEDYRMVHAPQAVVWTELPFNMSILKRQRVRWHRGLRQVMQGSYSMMGRPKYRQFGMICLPFQFLFEWLAVPIEALGWIMLTYLMMFGRLNVGTMLSMFLATQMLSTMVNFSAVHMAVHYLPFYRRKSDARWMLLWALASQYGYRQMTLVWRVRSLFPGGTGWGVMPRLGYAKPAGPPAAPATAG
jgi:cellulose synthase/poly-beta-1,6-N-acetylglucosamine synthase-like glycosyltransferase